ncbi:nucleoside hydrolase [Lentibacillus sp. Marseille-P4043]|uniref:nucleoside hydrolase n=1 Tax=Lentibacillus sp. Marseille-P4043 TaxID=2040293 RepID=UPI000D0B14B7|nr:nucleoside hydrolase [Lentibacillus sp. Marseille-P4043]
MTVKVLVFGDIGIDDTIALIYGYFKEEVDIVGVVADYGNVSKDRAVKNVQYVSNLLDITKKEVKIIGGANIPLNGEKPAFFPEIHGEYGLGPIIPPENMHDGVFENFFEIINIIKQYQDELIVVNIGRLTSLATMFILYRKLMKKVKSFYIMGGAFWVPGNITAVSEANFYEDPIAAKTVLMYAHNVTIIPLNVTEQAIVTPQMVDYIDYIGKTKIIKPMLDYYYNFYKKRNPNVQGSPVHDALTLIATIHEEMFIFKKLPVHIVQKSEGISKGQSIADIRPYLNPKNEKGKEHRIAFKLDYPKFYKEFMSVMTGESF